MTKLESSELEVGNPRHLASEQRIMLSIAISFKRIADALERMSKK